MMETIFLESGDESKEDEHLHQFKQDAIILPASFSANNENEIETENEVTICDYLHLPKPNFYVPTNLDLCSDLPPEATLGPRIDKVLEPPKLIINDKKKGRRLWHRLDDRYALPRSSMTIMLVNPNSSYLQKQGWEYSLEQSVKSSLLTSIFTRAMAQETYDADLAGLEWYLFDSSSGIQLIVHGYSNKLSQFALDLLKKFLIVENNHSAEHFCTESFFKITKERSINNCLSFYQSKRADTYASYYRDMILSSRSDGIEERMNVIQNISLESLKDHHQQLISTISQIQCFYTGNVSKSEAEDFFHQATSIVEKNMTPTNNYVNFVNNYWLQDSYARFLPPGEDIELHFTSQNPKEENGAVLVTFLSNTPVYRGDLSASTSPCLQQTASLKLLCHMLREPLFNELRTKQQLGYIVTSYYDMKLSSSGPPPLQNEEILNDAAQKKYIPWTFPIESIVVKVMSKAQDPPTVLQKVDEFMKRFRGILVNMPASKIRDHIDALSKNLLKPIQNLEAESRYHLNTITNCGPEFLSHNDAAAGENMPWNRVKMLADTIKTLKQSDLLQVWDRFVINKKERSRIVSCVYGSKFPIQPTNEGIPKQQHQCIVNDFSNLLSLRSKLEQYVPESSMNHEVNSNNTIVLCDLLRKMKKLSATKVGVAVLVWIILTGILIGFSLKERHNVYVRVCADNQVNC